MIKSGPKMEPWGFPHVTGFKFPQIVGAFNSIYSKSGDKLKQLDQALQDTIPWNFDPSVDFKKRSSLFP